MKYNFGEICIGDMFNTKPARWVKTSPTQAICVMSAIVPIGKIQTIPEDDEVILLWSCLLITEQ